MSRVFILEDLRGRKNMAIDEATNYGEIVYVFEAGGKRPSIWADEDFKKEISKRFQQLRFDPEKDYFCIVGYFVPIIIATVELILDYGEIRVLFFSATEQNYLPRRLGEKDVNDSPETTDNCEESNTISSGDV